MYTRPRSYRHRIEELLFEKKLCIFFYRRRFILFLYLFKVDKNETFLNIQVKMFDLFGCNKTRGRWKRLPLKNRMSKQRYQLCCGSALCEFWINNRVARTHIPSACISAALTNIAHRKIVNNFFFSFILCTQKTRILHGSHDWVKSKMKKSDFFLLAVPMQLAQQQRKAKFDLMCFVLRVYDTQKSSTRNHHKKIHFAKEKDCFMLFGIYIRCLCLSTSGCWSFFTCNFNMLLSARETFA